MLKVCAPALLAAACLAAPAWCEDAAPFSVSCQLDTGGASHLHCVVRNPSDRTIRVPFAAIPWMTPQALRVWAFVVADPVREIAQDGLAADPFGLEVAVKPGQSIEGEVDLEGRMPTLRAERRKSDVCVTWVYHRPAAPAAELSAGAGVLRKRNR